LPNLATGAIVQKRKKLMDQMLVHRLITTINCIIITSATKQGPPYPLPRYNPALLIPPSTALRIIGGCAPGYPCFSANV